MKHIKFRKSLAILGVFILSANVFVGCSTEEKSTNNTESTPSTGKTEEIPTITWYQQNHSAGQLTNMGESECFKAIEEDLGVNIEWQHPADGSSANDQLNLMIAANSLPDVVLWDWDALPGGTAKYIKEKTLMPINDMVEEYAPNYLAALEKLPRVKEVAYLDDGTMPGVYGMEPEDPRRVIYFGPMLRQDWLDKLGLAQPTTLDEWHTVLTAFKTQDPNGNGQPDEIPWTEQTGTNLDSFAPAFGILNEFFVDPGTGQIAYGGIRSEYKEFLMVMNQWYKEGLIDGEFATNDGKMYSSKIVSEKAGATAGYLSGTLGNLTAQGKQTNPDFQLMGVPHPKAANGIAYNGMKDYIKSLTGMGGISANCKNPEMALKILDYGYSEKGHDLLNWGIEGKSYEVVDGNKVFTESILNPPDGKTPAQAIIPYAYPVAGWSKIMDFDAFKEISYIHEGQLEAVTTWAEADNSLLIPYKVKLTAEESGQLATIMNEIKTYRDEMVLKFILGTTSVENEFDKYVEGLKKMGIEDAIAIWQGAYDRYK